MDLSFAQFGTASAAAGPRRAGLEEARSRSPPSFRNGSLHWHSAITEDWQRLQHAPAEVRADPDVICEAMRSSAGQALQYASDELRGDREFVLGAAQEIGAELLQHASKELRADREFMLEVADYCPPGEVLQHVTDDLRAELLADREFVLEAVQQIGLEVLENTSLQLRGDRDFLLTVAKYCPLGEVLQYATDALRAELYGDSAFMLQAVRDVGAEVLENASLALRGDRRFMLAAAECCPPGEVLQHATDALRAELYADRAFVLQAVRDVGSEALEYASPELRADRDFMLAAACYCPPGEALRYAARELCTELSAYSAGAPQAGQELGADGLGCLQAEAYTYSQAMSAFAPQVAPQVQLGVLGAGECVQEYRQPLGMAETGCPAPEVVQCNISSDEEPAMEPQIDPAAVLQAVRQAGSQALATAPLELRGDREFILAAAACRPLAEVFQYATDELRTLLYSDRVFMLRAVHEIGSSVLAHAPVELREDREFMLAAAACCPPREALQYASDKLLKELCADHSFMLKAVQQVGPAVLAHAAVELRGDRAFMLAAAACRPPGEVLKYASKKLRAELHSDGAYMLTAVQSLGPAELAHASAALRGDREFMLAAAAYCHPSEVLRYASQELCQDLRADRAFMLRAVQAAGAAELQFASAELCADRDFVLSAAAFCSLGEALGCASEGLRAELRGDQAFMLRALEEVGATELEHASAELRGDRRFMLAAEACCPLEEVLRCASEGLRAELCSDKAFVLRAVKELGAAVLEHASLELRTDLGFMMEVAGFCPAGEALQYASEELRAELDAD